MSHAPKVATQQLRLCPTPQQCERKGQGREGFKHTRKSLGRARDRERETEREREREREREKEREKEKRVRVNCFKEQLATRCGRPFTRDWGPLGRCPPHQNRNGLAQEIKGRGHLREVSQSAGIHEQAPPVRRRASPTPLARKSQR